MDRSEIAHRFHHYQNILELTEWEDMISAFAKPLPSTFWTHPNRAEPEWVARRFINDQHPVKKLPYAPGGYKAPEPMKWGRRFEFRAGLLHLQEAASMLPPLALDPQPGELVLDLCAAPGGKSAQLSLMMKNTGTLVVNDLSFARLRALRATQERLGLKNMVLCAQEGQKLLKDHPPYFDKVLVDAPCSCEGTLRKRGKWTYEPDHSDFKKHLVATQKALLLQALKLTRPGGRVVYSTCTLDPLENEGVVSSVLEQWTQRDKSVNPADIELEPLHFEGLVSSPGLTCYEEQTWSSTLRNTLRVYPHQNDSGGFFLASFKVGSQPLQAEIAHTQKTQNWAVPKRCTSEQKALVTQWAKSCFGLETSTWSKVSFTEANSRYISTVSPDLILPPTHYQVAGLPSFYIRGAVPRLTTAAALEWGHLANKSVVKLQSQKAVDQYYAGESQIINDLEEGMIKGNKGVCIPLYQGYPLGLAYLKQVSPSSTSFTLESEYPKRIRLAQGCSAFETASQARRSMVKS